MRLFAAIFATVSLAISAMADDAASAAAEPTAETKTAVFAGGCFWCTEADFEKVPGVIEAVSGFAGGHVENPTYRQVVGGRTGHLEAVEVAYDPSVVAYSTLVEFFWRTIDPTQTDGQFCDRGEAYRTAIFVAGPQERAIAEASKQALANAGRFARIDTRILDAAAFYPADEGHQDYYKSEELTATRDYSVGFFQPKKDAYAFYRNACGRDARLSSVWGEEAGGQSILEAAGLAG